MADGDDLAFETLYGLYHPRLTHFLFNILKAPELVEQVLNDTLTEAWRNSDRYNGTSNVLTWMFAIAYRQARRAGARSDETVERKDACSRLGGEAGPEQQPLESKKSQAALIDAIQVLSVEHRTVVSLTYIHQLGYEEIAEVMACSVDTVKTRMFHARRHLKNTLSRRLAEWP